MSSVRDSRDAIELIECYLIKDCEILGGVFPSFLILVTLSVPKDRRELEKD